MRLGPILRAYRVHREIPLQTLAGDIGISASSLSQIERGADMDGVTLIRILVWVLGKDETCQDKSKSKSKPGR